LKDATTDPLQIDTWWRQFPNALIGVPTGEAIGMWVLDIDLDVEKGVDGAAALARLEAGHGPLPRTVESRTPRGGRHLLFKWDPARPITNRSGTLPDGIDVRGDGGYFIVPPSTREDGARYEWKNPNDEPLTAPDWLYELIGARPDHRGAGAAWRAGGAREDAYARAALDGATRDVAAAPPGKRNDTLNAVAYRLGRMIARGWLGRAEVELRLLAAAHACGLIVDDGEHGARTTIQSGINAGLLEPHPDLEERALREASPNGAATIVVEEQRPRSFTDEALALRFAERHELDLRYVDAWGRWLRYDGQRWALDDTLLAFDLAREICREAAAECDNKKLRRVLASAKTVAAVERLSKADRRLAASTDQWDADPWLLNTPDGTLDLRTGQLRPHNRHDYLTKITSVSPDGGCPVWLAHLLRIMDGNSDLVAYLQRVFGYALTGSTREHALFFGYGTGANGKGVTIGTVANILAEYHRTAAIETFTASNSDRHPTELAGLRGARLVSSNETERGRQWAESRIKTLTGGDKIEARFMRQDFFEFQPQMKLFIFGNHKPGLTSVDEAIRRRLHLIPFTVTIPADERDKDLPERLRGEWPGILAWMVEGCLAWQREGLNPPAAVRDATAAYLENEDLFGQWLAEASDAEVGNTYKWEPVGVLYESWRAYADRAGEKAGSKKAFSETMQGRGFVACQKGHAKTRCLEGVRLRPTQDQRFISR
jgi:putative DNA primase/helicase